MVKFTIFVVLLLILPLASMADLTVGFYGTSCPKAEAIVRQAVQKRFNGDKSITGGLLRMHFHDCFVHGCDASILIDSKKGNQSEKDAGANGTVRGFEIIDEAKKALEKACPSTVSCADIITLATRDAVDLAGGPKYSVPTGRRDGLVSNPSDVNLPGPGSTVSQALQIFTSKGMSLNEMVTLLGAHTVGFAHCSFFRNRLGGADTTMDPTLDSNLVKLCGTQSKPSKKDLRTFLDQNTSIVFDNQFYKQILNKQGVLFIDQQLALDSSSKGLVSSFAANPVSFQQSFVNAIVKMGSIGVKVGNDGEIRRNCRVFNR
ncbi:hypothetical protein HN51_041016 [Arachis hypogaea]|uniref:Peroxidase n=1 Tax=Arachis hypogaea TaxID=3818 RepID=A0A444YQU9_ARAHY|nr:peroxidase 44 [Arachis ipaensis]XP_025658278.1 peroxidase 44 [Arachis hypogaea]QHN86708.1 Peroxidase [Arachis hypogaea]RYR04272.1 hypothetical protein Ahy_B06g083929 [Arachis hypogaea]